MHRTPIDAHEPENLKDLLGRISAGIDPVHRLDKPTSGVIVFGKDPAAIDACKQQFESRETLKDSPWSADTWTAPGCIGKPLPEGHDRSGQTGPHGTYSPVGTCELDYPVSRYSTARFSLIRCFPHTGRYHQIRLHFRHFRHPVMGDSQRVTSPRTGFRHTLERRASCCMPVDSSSPIPMEADWPWKPGSSPHWLRMDRIDRRHGHGPVFLAPDAATLGRP